MYCHSLRVHLQVCQWKFLNLICLKPEAGTRMCSVKKGVLRNLAKSTEKHLRQSQSLSGTGVFL